MTVTLPGSQVELHTSELWTKGCNADLPQAKPEEGGALVRVIFYLMLLLVVVVVVLLLLKKDKGYCNE